MTSDIMEDSGNIDSVCKPKHWPNSGVSTKHENTIEELQCVNCQKNKGIQVRTRKGTRSPAGTPGLARVWSAGSGALGGPLAPGSDERSAAQIIKRCQCSEKEVAARSACPAAGEEDKGHFDVFI